MIKRYVIVIASIALLLVPGVSLATIAFDAVSEHENGGTSPSWTHTPVGTPKGIFVGFTTITNNTDVNSVTYGGVSMTKIEDIAASAANRRVSIWFLGSNIPTGAQTVAASLSEAQNSWGVAVSVTAGAGKDTQLAGTGSGTADDASPSVVITGIAGASYGFGAIVSANDSPSGITADGNNTKRGTGRDFGSDSSGAESSTNEYASGDATMSFSSESAVLAAMAIEEVAGSSASGRRIKGYGISR